MRALTSGPTTTSSLSEEGRAFLQRRVARYALMIGSLGLAFYVLRLLLYAAAGALGLSFLDPSMNGHAAGALAMLGIYAVNARGRRPVGVILGTELLLFSVSCLAYGYMGRGMPAAFRPDLTLVMIFGIALLARSIYVPASWQWTAALATLLAGVVAWITLDAFGRIDEGFARASRRGPGRASGSSR